MPSEILMEFIEDSTEHLAAAGQHLLALEKDINQPDELNGLLRRIHTIKGNSGFLDLRHLYGLLHKTENILQGIREEKPAAWPSGLIDLQLQVLDTVEAMVNSLSEGGNDHVAWLDDLMSSLDGLEKEVDASAGPRRSETSEPEEIDDLPDDFFAAPESVVLQPSDSVDEVPPSSEPESLFDQLPAKMAGIMEALDMAPSFSGKEWAGQLQAVQSEFRDLLKPDSERALNLVVGYLDQLPDSVSLQPNHRIYLGGLVENFSAWLEVEKDKEEPLFRIVMVTSQNLKDQGRPLYKQVETELARRPLGLLFDLHGFQTMYSREIGILISSMKIAREKTRVAMILDPRRQSGLRQVFRVMGLDKAFQMFAELEDVRKAWGLECTG